jgi:hypothetical protein
MIAQVGYSVAGRSRGRVAPCAVCIVHVETRSTSFLVVPQNQGRRFEWFALKTTRTVFTGLASKPVVTVSSDLTSKPTVTVSGGLALKPVVTVFADLALKPVAMIFSGLASKPMATVFSSLVSKLMPTVSSCLASKPVVGFLFEPQNQGGGGFPGLGLKTGSFGLVIWASKSPRRFLGLGLKSNWASVCQLRHKTDGGRSARDTRRDLAACFT